jgi:hypothetical protein
MGHGRSLVLVVSIVAFAMGCEQSPVAVTVPPSVMSEPARPPEAPGFTLLEKGIDIWHTLGRTQSAGRFYATPLLSVVFGNPSRRCPPG